ncbi:MAG: VOC family protein [Chitinivibrionales bacterium]
MIRVHPYLNFDGTCEEAFNFYRSVFGGEFSSLMRYNEMPPSESPMPEDTGELIMHMSLPIGDGTVLMGSDVTEEMGQKLTAGNNMYIMLSPETSKEAEQIYKKLSAGGKIEMPLEKMFWGDLFASFIDRYGIAWMIDTEDS